MFEGMTVPGNQQWGFRLAALGMSAVVAGVLFGGYWIYRTHFQTIRMEITNPDSGVRLIYDAQLGWRNEPAVRSLTYGQPMSQNRFGLRGGELLIEKSEGRKRILVLGDSFAWGYGVGNEETFSAVLEEQLGSEKWEVINAGVSGWGTDQEYLYLAQEGFRYKPDVVVVAYFFGNDPMNNGVSKFYGRDKPVFLNTDLELANSPVPKPRDNAATIACEGDILELTTAILLGMAKDCAEVECPLVVMKFGAYVAPEDANVLMADQQIEKGLANRDELLFLDLDRGFAEQNLTYAELVGDSAHEHWNPFGHRQAAMILREFLEKSGLLREN